MGFLNKKIFNFGGNAFGLDLSDLSIKAIMLEEDGMGEKVVSFNKVKLPSGIISDGEIINKEQAVLSIEKLLETARPKKIKTRKVICSVPETKAFLRIITLPKMAIEEVREAIRWEIEANIPLPIDQVYFDWQILNKQLSKEEGKISILVVAISKKTADNILETLEAANLEVMGLEVESVAQSRCLVSLKEDNLTRLVIDYGDRRTGFLFLIDNFPCFTSSIPISSQTLTDAISKSLNLSLEEAEKIKIQYGIGSFAARDVLFKSMEPVLRNLVFEIEKSIDFFVGDLGYSKEINEIIICGGGANTKGILPFLSKKLNREVIIGDPWTNFKNKDRGELPLIEKKEAIQFSTAIGLALKGLNL